MFKKKKKQKIDKDYVEEEAGKISTEDIDHAVKNQDEVEGKILDSGTLQKYTEIIKQLFLMLNDYRKGKYTDVPWLSISTLVFILLYILNPLDLIPDFIPLIGYLDDVTVLAVGLNLIQTDLHKYLDWKKNVESEN